LRLPTSSAFQCAGPGVSSRTGRSRSPSRAHLKTSVARAPASNAWRTDTGRRPVPSRSDIRRPAHWPGPRLALPHSAIAPALDTCAAIPTAASMGVGNACRCARGLACGQARFRTGRFMPTPEPASRACPACAAGQARRPSLRAGFPAVLGLGARRATRFARCARYARTGAPSQFTKRAARAAPRPALLGAAHGPPRRPGSHVSHDRRRQRAPKSSSALAEASVDVRHRGHSQARGEIARFAPPLARVGLVGNRKLRSPLTRKEVSVRADKRAMWRLRPTSIL
jgi:hypothetical protein